MTCESEPQIIFYNKFPRSLILNLCIFDKKKTFFYKKTKRERKDKGCAGWSWIRRVEYQEKPEPSTASGQIKMGLPGR